MTPSPETSPVTTPTRPSGKTDAGRAISARNATTHGIFCRQTVLPHLGEDPAAYQRILDTLNEQLRPRNLMEIQYLELWAECSWKLRRLSRMEAEVWEDDSLDQDKLLTKLERLARFQTSLRRQMDKAVQLLSQTVTELFARRTREDVLEKMGTTDSYCSRDPNRSHRVEGEVLANLHWPLPGKGLTEGLDNVDNVAVTKNCQNEPPAVPSASEILPLTGGGGTACRDGGGSGVSSDTAHEKCQNELHTISEEPYPLSEPSPFGRRGQGEVLSGKGRPGGGSECSFRLSP
jgi:hypothetical protein